jgi:hypothetical protein
MEMKEVLKTLFALKCKDTDKFISSACHDRELVDFDLTDEPVMVFNSTNEIEEYITLYIEASDTENIQNYINNKTHIYHKWYAYYPDI